jgi:hypothetical protein
MTIARSKPTSRKPKATKTLATPAGRATSAVEKQGSQICVGACDLGLPVTKFPTYRNKEGEYVRADECRTCKAARRSARKDTK